jgi:hypothetical protein
MTFAVEPVTGGAMKFTGALATKFLVALGPVALDLIRMGLLTEFILIVRDMLMATWPWQGTLMSNAPTSHGLPGDLSFINEPRPSKCRT